MSERYAKYLKVLPNAHKHHHIKLEDKPDYCQLLMKACLCHNSEVAADNNERTTSKMLLKIGQF